jgi:hypothetical protein
MTSSTLTLIPGRDARPGMGANAERRPVAELDTIGTALERGGRDDYDAWLRHLGGAAGCTHPVRLTGDTMTVDTRTGEVISARSTRDMPDSVIYKPCGNRRATVCPSCAEVYRADAYQLVLAGLAGGKGVPESVAGHPAVFGTLTAPGFGAVHTRRAAKSGRAIACRPRRTFEACRHGVPLRCMHRHGENDPALGQPICRDCYDYDHHAVWNYYVSRQLWRRTKQQADRLLARHAKAHGDQGRVRLSYGKCAEYQRRGVVHYHALIRLDGVDPDNPDVVIPPPDWATVFVLAHVFREAVETTVYMSPPHQDRADGWSVAWGAQLDIRPLRVSGDKAITDTAVAGYLAKYATKGTDDAGHVSARITETTVDIYTDHSHPGRLINAAWQLGDDPDYDGLRRWAHMLGFGGQFFTKSQRYSTTFRALRAARTDYRRRAITSPAVDLSAEHDDDATIVINNFVYAGIGWHTTGDALLANSSAAMARERRRAAKDALTEQASYA